MWTISLRRLLISFACLCATAAFWCFQRNRAAHLGGSEGALADGLRIAAEAVVVGSCGIGISVGVLVGRSWFGAVVGVSVTALFLIAALCAVALWG